MSPTIPPWVPIPNSFLDIRPLRIVPPAAAPCMSEESLPDKHRALFRGSGEPMLTEEVIALLCCRQSDSQAKKLMTVNKMIACISDE